MNILLSNLWFVIEDVDWTYDKVAEELKYIVDEYVKVGRNIVWTRKSRQKHSTEWQRIKRMDGMVHVIRE